MKKMLLLFICQVAIIGLTFGQGVTPQSPSMSSGTNASVFGTQGTIGSNNATFFVTWDATYLYLGWSGGNTNQPTSDLYYAAIDTDPNGTNGATTNLMGVGFNSAAGTRRPDFYTVFENNNNLLGIPVSNANAIELHGTNSGAWSFISRTSANDGTNSFVTYNGSNGEVRLRIAWADLNFTPGSNTPLGITMWTNNGSGNFMWGRYPTQNPGTGSTSPTINLTHSFIFYNTSIGVTPSTAQVIENNTFTTGTITGTQALGVSVTGNASLGGATTFNSNLNILPGSTLAIGANDLTVNRSITGNGTLTGSANSNLSIANATGTINFTAGSQLLRNLSLSSGANITLGGTLAIATTGGGGGVTAAAGTTLTTAGNLELNSDATGTAQINNSAGTISGNISVQRFIPAKASRRWTFVSSPVSQQISQAWQQQAFITGTTTGTVCTVDASGFDIANTPSSSMFTYNATQVNGSRWVGIANTNATNLAVGTGYRMNIRGTRANGGGCTDQLNSANPTAPNAVTLSATGAYTASGTITINGTTAHGGSEAYSLIGNPHPATMAFSNFLASNSASITSQLWMYTSNNNVSNTYSSWNNGTTSGPWPAELVQGTNPSTTILIPSGAAFFVSTTQAANQNLAYGQGDKHSTAIGGNAGFSRTTQGATTYTWDALARITLQNSTGAYLDDAVVRFGNAQEISNTGISKFDGVSFNTGNGAFITTVKAGNNLTFNTRQAVFTNDTVQLNVFSSAAGNYKLSMSDLTSFAAAGEVILIDKFLNQTQNVKITPEYAFAVTTNPASVGANRFELVFRSAATLPVNFSLIRAQNSGTNGVTVLWNVPSETDIREYIIERSGNGSNFMQRGSVAATNASNALQYSFVDAPRLEGTSFYRVKAIARNGASKFSPVVSVRNGKVQEALQVLPNPVKDEATIVLHGFEGNVTLQLQSLSGALLSQRSINATQVNMVSIPVSGIPAGVYQVRAVQNGNVVTQKLIKQ